MPCPRSLVALGALPALVGSAQTPTDPLIRQLTGSWEGTDDQGQSALLQFQPGGTAQMTMNGKRLVPETPGGPYLRYHLDASRSPMWLDFIAFDPSHKELGRIRMLLQLLDEKTLRIETGEDFSVRPERMTGDPRKGVTLKKVY